MTSCALYFTLIIALQKTLFLVDIGENLHNQIEVKTKRTFSHLKTKFRREKSVEISFPFDENSLRHHLLTFPRILLETSNNFNREKKKTSKTMTHHNHDYSYISVSCNYHYDSHNDVLFFQK